MKNSTIRLISLIGLLISGTLGLLVSGATAYILLTDGLASLRGEGETGWASMIALIFYIPVAVALFAITFWCREKYKKYSLE